MEELNRFKKYLVESKDNVSSLKINEQDMPNLTDTDKEILDFVADRTDMLEPDMEASPYEVALMTLNQDYFINDGDSQSGFDFLQRAGGLSTISYLFEKAEEMGDVEYFAKDVSSQKWDQVARLYALYKGQDLLEQYSEVLRDLYSTEDELGEDGIENLNTELNFLIS